MMDFRLIAVCLLYFCFGNDKAPLSNLADDANNFTLSALVPTLC